MKITYSFYNLKDLSDISYGKSFLEIMEFHGLIITKGNIYEPINKDFDKDKLEEIWQLKGIYEFKEFTFLFKGQKELRFSGMISVKVNLGPKSKVVNGVHLFITFPPKYDTNKIIQLGDDLYEWIK